MLLKLMQVLSATNNVSFLFELYVNPLLATKEVELKEAKEDANQLKPWHRYAVLGKSVKAL